MHFSSRSKLPVILSTIALVTFLSMLAVFRASPAQAVAADNWTMYLHDPGRSGFNSTETIINSTSASNLKLTATAKTNGCPNSPGGPVTISTQLVVSQALQLIFWGSWDGCEHATNLSGTEVWATYIGQINSPKCAYPSTVGVASTATLIREMINGVMTPVLLLGGGDANFYALSDLEDIIEYRPRQFPLEFTSSVSGKCV